MRGTPNDPYFAKIEGQPHKKKGSVWVLGIDMLNQNHVWSMFRASLRFMSWSYWFQAKEGIATRNARHIGTAPRLGGVADMIAWLIPSMDPNLQLQR